MTDVLSVIAAYLLTLVAFRMAVAVFAGGLRVPAVDVPDAADDEYERPQRGNLTVLTLIVPVLGILWAWTETSSWSEMFADGLSDLGYVLFFAMLFPRSDIVGLGSRRAKFWVSLGFSVVGAVIYYLA